MLVQEHVLQVLAVLADFKPRLLPPRQPHHFLSLGDFGSEPLLKVFLFPTDLLLKLHLVIVNFLQELLDVISVFDQTLSVLKG